MPPAFREKHWPKTAAFIILGGSPSTRRLPPDPRGDVLRSDYWYRFPWLLLAAALALVGLGIAGIYAATAGRADCPPELQSLAEKQVVFLAGSLVVFCLTLIPSYVRLARFSYALYGVSLALLVLLAVMRRFDLVIDLQGLFRSGFLALVTGARTRVGFANARELGRKVAREILVKGGKEILAKV
jgi:hypothetical protein